MTQPSKFISNSDFSSTPSSLLPPKHLVLTPPTSFNVPELTPVIYKTTARFAQDFDSFVSYLSADDEDDMIINGEITIAELVDGVFVNGWVKAVMINSRTIELRAIYSSFSANTFHNHHTFKATIIPILSPYQAQ